MKKGFNLLRAKFETPNFWTKAYDWVVNSAKVVIIITELFVIIAFAIRFIIDMQQKQLDKDIAVKEGIYNAMAIQESKFIDLQAKTKGYKELISLIPEYEPAIRDLQSNITIGGSVTRIAFDISSDGVTISGSASKSASSDVQALENNLKANTKYFVDTTLTTLVDDATNLNFTFSTKLKEITYKSIDGSTKEEETNN